MRKIKFLSVFVLLALLLSAVPPTMAQKPPPHWSDPAVVHSLDEPPVEQVPPDIPPEDANWPIIEQWTRTEVDARGGGHTITYTIRQNPAPIELQATEAGCKLSEGSSPAGPMATSATCTYLGTFSQSASHTIQGITQCLKSYYYKYRWEDGVQTYAAYRTYKTEEWWTRTSTQYGLADNDTDWNYYGWDCDNHWQVKDAHGSFWPQWYNNTETYHYIYDFTKNWPILTPGAYVGAGVLRTRETTPAYKGGYIGTLETEVRYRNW